MGGNCAQNVLALLEAEQRVVEDEARRLVADDVARAPYRVAKAERGLLTGEAGGAAGRLVAVEVTDGVGRAVIVRRTGGDVARALS